MQLLDRYQRVIEKLLRPGTRRRYYYELGRSGIHIILNEGWGSFFRKVRYWFRLRREARARVHSLPQFRLVESLAEAEGLSFPPPSPKPQVSIIIPVYNNWRYTLTCLRSVCKSTEGNYEVIVVDDCSTDETHQMLSKVNNLRVISNTENMGFVESCNKGAQSATGRLLLFLNNDTIVTDGWLPLLVSLAARDDVGAVGPKFISPAGTLNEAGLIIWSNCSFLEYGSLDNPGRPEYNYVREVDSCSGAAFLVKKELFEQIGGLDTRYKPAFCEETDLLMSIRDRGYKVMYQPKSVVVHFMGTSYNEYVSTAQMAANWPKFVEKWKDTLQKQHCKPGPENVHRARDRRPGKSILVIDMSVPTYDKDADSLRMFNMLRILSELGHRVTFISDTLMPLEPYTEELQQEGIEVIYHPYFRSVENYIRRVGKYFDVVILSRPRIAIKYIDTVKKSCPQAKIIFDTVDLESLREQRRAEVEGNQTLAKEAEKLKARELYLAQNSALTLTVSQLEKELLLQQDPSLNVEVVSTVYPVTSPRRPFSERQDILFVGSFSHLPNGDAAIFFIKEIFPLIKEHLPTVRFYVVGSNPLNDILTLKSNDVLVTGYVRDLTPYFENCKLSVAPLRYGAGAKGKINQSMGYGLPVVTTSIGAEGLELTNGENALIVDDPQEFAQKVIWLYDNEVLWNKLSQNSIEYGRKHFSSEVARTKLQKVLTEAKMSSIETVE